MKLFWILWGVDAFCTLIALYFFSDGLSMASNTSTYLSGWLPALGCAGAILIGSLALKNAGYLSWAKLCVAIGALPAVIGLLFTLLMLSGNNKWN